MNALSPASVLPSDLATALASHAEAAAGAYSGNTERALKADIRVFTAWAAESGLTPLPAAVATVCAFIDAMADLKAPATVRRYVSSIGTFHKAAGVESPTGSLEVGLALKRMHRAVGRAQAQAEPLTRARVERLLEAADAEGSLLARRDKAVLSLAYDSLARRSEIVALQLADLERATDGSGTILIRRSKTDGEGAGLIRYLHVDTMNALADWIAAAGIESGPLFRSVPKGGRLGGQLHPGEVARIFKKMASQAGLKAKDCARISGHSSRVGAACDMAAAGLGMAQIQQAGGWRTAEMISRYTARIEIRRGGAAQLAAVQGRG